MPARHAPAVILVRPTESGNVGSVARAMANTGLDELVLVEPAAPCDRTAHAFAVGATEILDSARRSRSFAEAAAPYQQLIGTSSQRRRVAKVPVLTPRTLAARLNAKPQPRTALVFGPERSGLTTDELAACSTLVSIPASLKQPTFNLGQAVLILAYELFVAELPMLAQEEGDRANMEEIEGLLSHARTVLSKVGFARDDTFAAVFRDFRRLSMRSELTSREVSILRGMLRRTERVVDSRSPESPTDG